MSAAIVIPARYASTRFPGKPLALIAGRSLIQRVHERVTRSKLASMVLVATDDQRIFDHVESFGGRAVMTDSNLPSGTDRIAAAVRTVGESFSQVINVQGDEPLIAVDDIDRLILALQSEPDIDIVTLATMIESEQDFGNRDVVKVVSDLAGNALYFSRSPIPYGGLAIASRHVGIYGYQTAALARFVSLPPSSLEQCESLEQLRALQNGFRIRLLRTDKPHLGVDRPEDVERVERELERLQNA